MNVLFLGDNPTRHRNFKRHAPYATFVEDVPSTIAALENSWDLVFLDHDLGGEQYVDSSRDDCGMEVVRWIVENKPEIKAIICHTAHSDAGVQMVESLSEAGDDARRISFYRLIFENELTPVLSEFRDLQQG